MAEIKINQELNGIEITFDSKPGSATLEALKSAGYRWHRVKKMWYAKNTAERLTLAESLTGSEAATPAETEKATGKINLDNLGENKPNLYGAELAKAIRDDLKTRGVKGVTVKANRGGYTTSITVTIKATPEDFVSVEEGKKRFSYSLMAFEAERGIYQDGKYIYKKDLDEMTGTEKDEIHGKYIKSCINRLDSVNHYHIERKNFWEFSPAFFDKVDAVIKIANQWNYDNSDIMTDYFDVGYYLHIDIKKCADFSPRETMTDADKDAYKAELEEEERQRKKELAEYEERQRKAEEERKKYNEWLKVATEEIKNNTTVVDLDESEQLYITSLLGGTGKEANIKELKETIDNGHALRQEAHITRKVIFNSKAAFDYFNELYLQDFDFLAGKGGTATQDKRLSDEKTLYRMTEEQRETIKFYLSNCVAIYFEDELKLIIDPEGYNYARYVHIPTETTETQKASEALKMQEKESESKKDFYFPKPVKDQAQALEVGQDVTIYKCDGWILNSIYAGSGKITALYFGNYAQYDNVLWLELESGRKTKKVYIRDNAETLVYKGIKPALPESVTSRRISENMVEMLNYNELLPNTYNYYTAKGEKPLIDTCYR